MMAVSRGDEVGKEEEEKKTLKLYFIALSEKKTSKGGKLYCK